jgi:hypothetical protein
VTEPIVQIPSDGSLSPRDRQVVELAGPDGAINIDAPPELATTAAASLGLNLAPVEEGRWGITSMTSHPAALALVANTVDGSNGYVIPAADAPLWQATAAGDLLPDDQHGLDPSLSTVRRARFDHELGEAQRWEHTLLGCTTVSMPEQQATPLPMHSPTVIWLVADDSLDDCIGFWNVRALRPRHLATLPMYLLPADLGAWTTWPRSLHKALRRPDYFSPDVLLTSATVDPDGMRAFAEHARLQLASDQRIRRFLRSDTPTLRTEPFSHLIAIPEPLVGFHREYGEREFVDVPFLHDRTTLRFLNPVPVRPGVGGMTLIRIKSDPFEALPPLDCVARLVDPNAHWHGHEIQLSAVLARDYRLEISVPTLTQACEAILQERTLTHATSHKGAIGTALLKHGVTDALGELNVYEAIRQLTTPRSDHIARRLQQLFGAGESLTDEQNAFVDQFAAAANRPTATRLGWATPRHRRL